MIEIGEEKSYHPRKSHSSFDGRTHLCNAITAPRGVPAADLSVVRHGGVDLEALTDWSCESTVPNIAYACIARA